MILRRLPGVGVGADPEVDVGLRHRQLFEEDFDIAVVVVLPGVHEELLHPRRFGAPARRAPSS